MNVFIPQDEFHALAIHIWSIGEIPTEWKYQFNNANIKLNYDWLNMYLDIFDKDYAAYVLRTIPKLPETYNENN